MLLYKNITIYTMEQKGTNKMNLLNNKYDYIVNMLYEQDLSTLGRYQLLKQFNLTPQENIMIQHRLMIKQATEREKQESQINDIMQSKEIKKTIQEEIGKQIEKTFKNIIK